MKILATHLFLVLPLVAAEFRSDWQGTRPWVGPEYWAGPLYDWKTSIPVGMQTRILHTREESMKPAKTRFVELSLAVLVLIPALQAQNYVDWAIAGTGDFQRK